MNSVQFSSVQSLSCVRLFVTPWTAVREASLSITNSQSSPKLIYIELVMQSNHLTLCRPFLLLPSIESFQWVRWSKYWNFSFNISSSNEHSGLISFRIDWLDLLAVQGLFIQPSVSHDVQSYFIGKGPDAGKDWRQEEKGMTEDEMLRWHHWLKGHEFE